MNSNIGKAKANEAEVLKLLNGMPESNFKMHPEKYSHYDILGTTDGNDTVIEVKERRQIWPTWYIEVKKVNDMCAQLSKEGKDCKDVSLNLCYSVEGKHYLYDIKDISKNWKLISKSMNKTTAAGFNGQGRKVTKDVYEFKFDTYKLELSSMDLGHLYEEKVS